MKVAYTAQHVMLMSKGHVYHLQRGDIPLPAAKAVKLLKKSKSIKNKKKSRKGQ
ncbi:MAG: hypothetical protein KC493_09765 [Bacteriovoracaceae bacterium]|nr:hypothetical protein [Bacteriovoracaceae bacterium]